ncbi:MAG: PspC domain-containing protein [Candidatus Aenigmarchaeota archaeon]|nr:PspC domain-containing protein [Candidatus Aenigmarchaeota archaeon]
MAAKRKSSAKKTKSKARTSKSSVKKLYRSGKDKYLGGVCGGLAEYLNVDPTIIRLLWALSSLVWGTGVILYLLAWLVIPRNPNHKW